MTERDKQRAWDAAVIDYGVGNHLSVVNALRFLGYHVAVIREPAEIRRAGAYILPGVGAFPEAIENLRRLGIVEELEEQVCRRGKPILGICLGMQILAEESDEGGRHAGLGWIPGRVERIPDRGLRVPHVGWNNVTVRRKDPLFSRLPDDQFFYFDHSYHFATDVDYLAAVCRYGQDLELTAAVVRDNIFGVQFHPEKSQNNGLRLLRGFFHYAKIRQMKEAADAAA